jgi:hypothetical protein
MTHLTINHRVADPQTLEIHQAMRTRVEHGDYMRQTYAAEMNPERARAFQNDPGTIHVATTNVLVDEINDEYTIAYAASERKKIYLIQPKRGSCIRFVQGSRLTLLQNMRTDYGASNGMFCRAYGLLFEENGGVI